MRNKCKHIKLLYLAYNLNKCWLWCQDCGAFKLRFSFPEEYKTNKNKWSSPKIAIKNK